MALALDTIAVQVKTDLEAIDGTGSYLTTIQKVHRDRRDITQIRERPALLLVTTGEDKLTASAPQRKIFTIKMTVVIVIGALTADAEQELTKYVHDVKLAMAGSVNRKHSGLCYNTLYTGLDLLAVEGVSVATALVDFDLLYSFDIDAP